eukprot:765649-Hanusia_phi.AAC.2
MQRGQMQRDQAMMQRVMLLCGRPVEVGGVTLGTGEVEAGAAEAGAAEAGAAEDAASEIKEDPPKPPAAAPEPVAPSHTAPAAPVKKDELQKQIDEINQNIDVLWFIVNRVRRGGYRHSAEL